MKILRLLNSILLLACLSVFPLQAQQLKFGEDKKFKIVQFTDVHWMADSIASEEAVNNEGSFLIGTRKEKVCAPEINTGLFAAMQEAGDVLGVFVGHDHVNDYAVSWKGIMLCYGRYTGGKTVYHDIPGGNGARIIELTEGKREFSSWIRLEGGKVINEFIYPSEWIK